MQPLLMLKQTLHAPYDPGPLLIDGPNVRFTSVDQIMSHAPGKDASKTFQVGVEWGGEGTITNVFKAEGKGGGLSLSRMDYRASKEAEALVFSLTQTKKQILGLLPKRFRSLREEVQKDAKTPVEWRVTRDKCFLGVQLSSPGAGGELMPVLAPTSRLQQEIRKVIHVPGLRGNPERTYKTTSTGPVFEGTFQDYVASVVHHWQSTRHSRLKKLGRTLEKIGLTWKVSVKRVDDTQVELRVGRLVHGRRGGARDMVSIADVGFGVSQVLPVLVALLVAEPGQMVYLEQPEIHLHPRAQVALAEVIAEAAKRGVRVIVETHSALLLLGIQSLVAEGKIPTEKVVCHWFQRSAMDGSTKVTSAELDEAGAFGDWPEDFADVDLDAQRRYLDAAEKRSRAR